MPMGRWAKTAGTIADGVDANGPLGEDRWAKTAGTIAAGTIAAGRRQLLTLGR